MVNQQVHSTPESPRCKALPRLAVGPLCQGGSGAVHHRCQAGTARIKVPKRMAYSYQNHEYFILKIRAAFPGNR